MGEDRKKILLSMAIGLWKTWQKADEGGPPASASLGSLAKSGASLFPFTLSAPQISMIHAVNFATLFGVTSWTTNGRRLDLLLLALMMMMLLMLLLLLLLLLLKG